MDELRIRLDCDEWTNYGNLIDKSGKIKCPVCKNHMIDVEFCLNLLVNKEQIKRKKIKLALEENIEKSFEKNLEKQFDDNAYLIDLQCENLIKDISNYRQSLINNLATSKQDCTKLIKKMDFKKLSNEAFEKEINAEKNLMKRLEIEQKYEDIINEMKTEMQKKINEKYYVFAPKTEKLKIDQLIGKLKVYSLNDAPNSFNYNLNDCSNLNIENYLKNISNMFAQSSTNNQNFGINDDNKSSSQQGIQPKILKLNEIAALYQIILDESEKK